MIVAVAANIIQRYPLPVVTTAHTEKEFVCYDDDKLVERYVGVKHAGFLSYDNTWRITYLDSDIIAYYHQPEGENCWVEVVQ